MKIEFTEEQLNAFIYTRIGAMLLDRDLDKILKLKMEEMLFQVEFKHKARIDALEHKLEALSRNMDALASRL